MSQQLSAGRSFHGRKFFSTSSAASGTSQRRSGVFPSAVLFGRTYEAWRHSSQSLQNTDRCKWLSSDRSLAHRVCGGWRCRGIPTNSEGGSHRLSFHSRSCKSEGICEVHVSESLLQPLDVKVDPEIQHIRKQDREQMKTLNNQFASLIDKVQHLEQQNRVLATKWDLLQKQVLPSQKNTKHVFDNFICSLQRWLDSLLDEQGQMEPELSDTEKLVEEFRCKYKQEVSRRMAAENEFVLLKKDVDSVYLAKAELEAKVETLKQEIEFLKCVSAQETAELVRSPCDTSAIVKMDNSRGLDMEGVLRSAECWYEDIAQKSKAVLDALCRTSFQELEEAKGRDCNEMKSHQQETEELSFVIQRRQCDLEKVKKQVSSLQTSVCETEQRRDCALKRIQEKHVELQDALQKARDELGFMLRDYQELLNVKLALDIEIATYKTLLEGDESRIRLGSPVRALITSPCSNISGCEADLGCGSGREARRCKSSCSAGRPSLPKDASACHRGFTSRSIGSSVGEQSIPGGPSCTPRSEEFRARGGGHSCQSSAPLGTGGLCSRTAGSCGESCRAAKSMGNSAHPQGMCWPRGEDFSWTSTPQGHPDLKFSCESQENQDIRPKVEKMKALLYFQWLKCPQFHLTYKEEASWIQELCSLMKPHQRNSTGIT